MPDTFAPPENPGYPVELEPASAAHVDAYESGAVQSRAQWGRILRRWAVRWEGAPTSIRDYVKGFWARQRGKAQVFVWALPDAALYYPRPAVAPTVDYVAGGALLLRTYDIAVAWGNAVGETQRSPLTTLQIPANNRLRVAVGEDFPSDATFAAVYAAVTGSAVTRQGQINVSGGTFTEPGSGLVAGAAPSSVNAMRGTVRVAFGGRPRLNLTQAGVWDIDLTLEERAV